MRAVRQTDSGCMEDRKGRRDMGKVSTDQKLQLVQRIRAESIDNRMRMRSRERLLYGTEAKAEDEIPLYGKYHDFGDRRGKELYALEEADGFGAQAPFSSFKLRLVLAAILFTVFLVADADGGTIAGISTAAVREEINKDFGSGLDEVIFDFEHNFPYTLFMDDTEEGTGGIR